MKQKSVVDAVVGLIEEERLEYTKPPWVDEPELPDELTVHEGP